MGILLDTEGNMKAEVKEKIMVIPRFKEADKDDNV